MGMSRSRSAAGSQVGVSYTEHYQLKKPTVTSSTSNGGVQLTATCPGWDLRQQLRDQLHPHRAGDGHAESAQRQWRHSVTGSSAALSLDSGNGGIEFDNVTGDVVAHTGNGGISGSQVSSKNVQASTGNGGIHITWSMAPTTVVATTGNGGIHLVVPQGSGPYRTSTHTGNGTIHVSLAESTRALPHRSTADTGNGGITIGYPTS